MNLLQTIHARWAADADLTILLPATDDNSPGGTNRVHTGMDFDPTLPFAVIELQGSVPEQIDQCGRAIDRASIRIQVFTADHAQGEKIIHAIKAAFTRSDFDLLAGSSSSSGVDADRVMNMQRTNDSQFQEPDGTWRFVIDFDCWVFLLSGY